MAFITSANWFVFSSHISLTQYCLSFVVHCRPMSNAWHVVLLGSDFASTVIPRATGFSVIEPFLRLLFLILTAAFSHSYGCFFSFLFVSLFAFCQAA